MNLREFQGKQFHSVSFGKQESRKSTSRFQGEDTSDFKNEELDSADKISQDNVLQNLEQYDISDRKQQNIENLAKQLQQKQINSQKIQSEASQSNTQGRYSSFQSQQLAESGSIGSDNFEFEEEENYQKVTIPIVDLNEQKVQEQFHFADISFNKQIESEKLNPGINAQHFEWTLQKTVDSDIAKPQESYEFQEVHINFNFNQDSERILNFQNKIPALQEIKSFKQVNGEQVNQHSNEIKSLRTSNSTNHLDQVQKKQIDQDVKQSMKLNSPFSMKAATKKQKLRFQQSEGNFQFESGDQIAEIFPKAGKDQQSQTMLTESSQDPLNKSPKQSSKNENQQGQSQQNSITQQPSPLASNRLKNLELINDIMDKKPSNQKKVKKVTKSKSAISLLQNKKNPQQQSKQELVYQSMTQQSDLSRQSSSSSIQGLTFASASKDLAKPVQNTQNLNSLSLEQNDIKLNSSFDLKVSQKSPQKKDQKTANQKSPPKSAQKKVGSPSQKQKSEGLSQKLQSSLQPKDQKGQKTVKQMPQINSNQSLTQSLASSSAQSPDTKSKQSDKSAESFNLLLIKSQEQENSVLEQSNASIKDQMLETNEFDNKLLESNDSPTIQSNQRKKADSLQPKKVSQVAKKSVGKANSKAVKSPQKKSKK